MYCYVPACPNGKSSSKKCKGIVHIFFSGPEDKCLFKKWQEVVPKSDHVFSREDKLCELHFQKSEVILFIETKLPNGNVRRLPASEPKLKPGTIPSIFPSIESQHIELVDGKVQSQPNISRVEFEKTKVVKRKASVLDLSEMSSPAEPKTEGSRIPRPRGRPRRNNIDTSLKISTPSTEKRRKMARVEPLVKKPNAESTSGSHSVKQPGPPEIDENSDISPSMQPVPCTIRLVPLESLLENKAFPTPSRSTEGPTGKHRKRLGQEVNEDKQEVLRKKTKTSGKKVVSESLYGRPYVNYSSGVTRTGRRVKQRLMDISDDPLSKELRLLMKGSAKRANKERKDLDEISAELEKIVNEITVERKEYEDAKEDLETPSSSTANYTNDEPDILEYVTIKSDPDEEDDQKETLRELRATLEDSSNETESIEHEERSSQKEKHALPKTLSTSRKESHIEGGKTAWPKNLDRIPEDILKLRDALTSDDEGKYDKFEKEEESDLDSEKEDLEKLDELESSLRELDQGVSTDSATLEKEEDTEDSVTTENKEGTKCPATIQSEEVAKDSATIENKEITEHSAATETEEVPKGSATIENQENTEDSVTTENKEDPKHSATIESEGFTKGSATIENQEATEDSITTENKKVTKDSATIESEQVAKDPTTIENEEVTKGPATIENQDISEDSVTTENKEVIKDSTNIGNQDISEDSVTTENKEVIKDSTNIENQDVTEDSVTNGNTEVTKDIASIESTEVAKHLVTIENQEDTEDVATNANKEVTKESEAIENQEVTKDSIINENTEVAKDLATIETTEVAKHSSTSEIQEDTEDTGTNESKNVTNDSAAIENQEVSNDSVFTENTEVTKNSAVIENQKVTEGSVTTENQAATKDSATSNIKKDEGDKEDMSIESRAPSATAEEKEVDKEMIATENVSPLPIPEEREDDEELNNDDMDNGEADLEKDEESPSANEPRIAEVISLSDTVTPKVKPPTKKRGELKKSMKVNGSDHENYEEDTATSKVKPRKKKREVKKSMKVSGSDHENYEEDTVTSKVKPPKKKREVKKSMKVSGSDHENYEEGKNTEVSPLKSTPGSETFNISSDSEADPTWEPDAEAIQVSDESDTDPEMIQDDKNEKQNDTSDGIEDTPKKQDPAKTKNKNKEASTSTVSPTAPPGKHSLNILTKETIQQILKQIKLPLTAPVTLKIAPLVKNSDGELVLDEKILANSPPGLKKLLPREVPQLAQVNKANIPKQVGKNGKNVVKDEGLAALKMFGGLGKIKKTFEFSTFLTDVEDELQFKKFCFLVKECLRIVRDSKNAKTNIGKLSIKVSPKTITNPLPQLKTPENHISQSSRSMNIENNDEAEVLECMTVDSNIEDHIGSKISPEKESV